LVSLLLLAWVLRLPPALDNRFHPDEALYGYWGLLIGRGQDPWLAAVPADKPPLLPYLAAGAQALFGDSEFAVRLVGLAAGLLTVPLVAALAYALYRDRWTAAAAAVGVALSPFAILFSATAFTDPLMVALGLAACVAAARGRSGWAGLLAGLAVATKQTGVVWVPLVAAFQISNLKSQIPKSSHSMLFICHLSFVILLVFVWDAVRVAQGAESFWRAGVTDYGGLRLIWPQELWARLRGWTGLARCFFVSPVVNGALLAGLPVLVWHRVRRSTFDVQSPKPKVRGPSLGRYTRGVLADLFFVFFLLIYLLLHWLLAFPIWDRYLLPLLPVLAVLLGRVLALFASYLQSANRHLPSEPLRAICHLSLAIFLAWPAFNAAHSRYPVGGDHGAYDPIDKVAAFLRGLPEGTVVYQHWLGWHYDYYLFDAPVYLAYWPTPAWLARDVQAFGATELRYLAFPSWESPARVEWALAGVGYGLEPVLTTTRRDGTSSFTVYRVLPCHFERADNADRCGRTTSERKSPLSDQ
jgi:4-amino-4-deoxy-L-arabinose transferase-like glycosyltransferase